MYVYASHKLFILKVDELIEMKEKKRKEEARRRVKLQKITSTQQNNTIQRLKRRNYANTLVRERNCVPSLTLMPLPLT